MCGKLVYTDVHAGLLGALREAPVKYPIYAHEPWMMGTCLIQNSPSLSPKHNPYVPIYSDSTI